MVNLFKLRLQTEYLRFLLKRNARYMFIMSVAMLTLYPILGITVNILTRSSNYDGIREVGIFFNISLLLLTSFLIPLQIHGYMNSKKNLDVYHALPIKRQDLFLSSLIASLLIIAVPFTVGWFSGGLLMINDAFNFVVILQRYVVLLSISSAIVSIVLFTMMNTGTSLDAFLYAMVLNFLPILAYGAYILFVQTILLGFTIGDLTKYISVIFPIWALFDNGFALKAGLWDSAWINAFYWLIISGIILALSNQFYLKRKSEKAEKPFTNKTFFPSVSGAVIILFIIFLYCVIYSVTSSTYYTSYYNPINFIFPIFFSVVLYLVMDAIAERGFKHLFKAFLNYLVIAAIALSLLLGGLITKGFGYASKIPSLSDIESIDLVYEDYLDLVIPSPDNYDGGSFANKTLNLTSPEDIQAVYDLHKVIVSEFKWIDYNYSVGGRDNLISIIEGRKGYVKSYEPLPFTISNTYSGTTVTLKITYHLKGGRTLERDYSIPTQWTSSLLKLGNSSEIIKLVAPNLAQLDTYSRLTNAKWLTPLSSNPVPLTSNLNLQALKTAYLADLANLSDDEINSTEYTAYGSLLLTTCSTTNTTLCLDSSLDVDSRYPQVIAVLNAAGISMTPTPNLELRAVLLIPSLGSSLVNDNPLFKVALSQSSNRYAADLFIGTETQTAVTLTYVTLTSEELLQILPYVTQKGISSTPLMSLILENGVGNLLIQAQYADEVNAIITGKPLQTSSDIYTIFYGVNPK